MFHSCFYTDSIGFFETSQPHSQPNHPSNPAAPRSGGPRFFEPVPWSELETLAHESRAARSCGSATATHGSPLEVGAVGGLWEVEVGEVLDWISMDSLAIPTLPVTKL